MFLNSFPSHARHILSTLIKNCSVKGQFGPLPLVLDNSVPTLSKVPKLINQIQKLSVNLENSFNPSIKL